MEISIIDRDITHITHSIHEVIFFGETVVTTVTHDPAISAQWISEVEGARDHLGHLLVGLDIEWCPSTHRNTQYPAATLQLCVGRRCLIYQLIHSLYTPSPLNDFLANKNCNFVGIGVKEDLERLQEDYDSWYDANVVDLRGLAAEVYDNGELRRAGLKGLAKAVLGKEVEKPKNVTMSRGCLITKFNMVVLRLIFHWRLAGS